MSGCAGLQRRPYSHDARLISWPGLSRAGDGCWHWLARCVRTRVARVGVVVRPHCYCRLYQVGCAWGAFPEAGSCIANAILRCQRLFAVAAEVAVSPSCDCRGILQSSAARRSEPCWLASAGISCGHLTIVIVSVGCSRGSFAGNFALIRVSNSRMQRLLSLSKQKIRHVKFKSFEHGYRTA